MVVLREYHSSEKNFILNYLKDQQNINEAKKMPSIDEVLRSQLKMFPISSDQGQADMKKLALDIPSNYSAPPQNDKTSVIETKIRGILANKQPTDFAVKMFEPLNNVARKPAPSIRAATKPSAKAISTTTKPKPALSKPGSGQTKVQKSVKIKTPETKTKPETKLAGVIKKDKIAKPKAKLAVKTLIRTASKPTATKLPRLPDVPRTVKTITTNRKIKKLKVDRGPKIVKQGSVSFPRLVKIEKPVPKSMKRKKIVKTPEKKITKPSGLPIKTG